MLLGTTVPDVMAPLTGATISETSRGSPCATRCVVVRAPPYVTFTLRPVLASNFGRILSTATRVGFGARSVISFCARALKVFPDISAATEIAKNRCFGYFKDGLLD